MKKPVYQVLTDREHIRARPGMWVGDTSLKALHEWVYDPSTKKMVKRDIEYIPALVKCFSEILDNAIDETRRHPEISTSIRVEFDEDGSITIQDNGTGIHVAIHEQTGKYIPETVFTNLRAGSNFDDSQDQQLIGTNGVGSSCVVVLSSKFRVETCDGKKCFTQVYLDGMNVIKDPVIKDDSRNRTRITFTPDYQYFKLPGLTEGNKLRMIKKVVDAAACNLNVKFYVDSERILIRDFDDYIALYAEEFVSDSTPDWKVGISASEGFEQISFVNSVETYQGGTHVDYTINQIVNELREHIRKKHKIVVKPADIRGHLRIYISANINRPRFSSQTKENLLSPVSEYKTSWTVPDKMIKKIIQSSIIQSILEWAQARAHAEELKELRKLNKDTEKVNLKKVKKFHDATEKDRSKTLCFLSEGDSAVASILGARDPKLHAAFPMRGRPINVSAAPLSKVRENEEFENIRVLIGLKYGEPADIQNLNFGKIVIASDADEFGHSIAGLIINMFYRLWPEIVEAGILYRLMTPMVVVVYKKQELEFFSEHEFEEWRLVHTGERYEYTFLKGLGSSPPKAFKNYMQNLDKYLVQFTLDDKADIEALNIGFLKESESADIRKVWLDLE